MKLTIGNLKALINETLYHAWKYRSGKRVGDPIEVEADNTRDAGFEAAKIFGGGVDPFSIDLEEVEETVDDITMKGFGVSVRPPAANGIIRVPVADTYAILTPSYSLGRVKDFAELAIKKHPKTEVNFDLGSWPRGAIPVDLLDRYGQARHELARRFTSGRLYLVAYDIATSSSWPQIKGPDLHFLNNDGGMWKWNGQKWDY